MDPIPYTAPLGVRLVKAEHPAPPVVDGSIAPPVPAGTVYARAPDGSGTRRAQAPQVRPAK